MEEETKKIIKRGRLNPMTQEKFDRVKELLYTGTPNVDIHNELGVAYSSIERIRKANSIGEYRELGRMWGSKFKKQKVEIKEAKQKLLDAMNEYIESEVKFRIKERLQKIT